MTLVRSRGRTGWVSRGLLSFSLLSPLGCTGTDFQVRIDLSAKTSSGAVDTSHSFQDLTQP
jgi:hypothetical protein